MGMFDTVKVEIELEGLPEGVNQSELEFQTKDFDCILEVITLTKEGRLIHDEWHYEDVPESELEDAERPWLGCIRQVIDRSNVDMNYHGFFEFYSGLYQTDDGKWHRNRKFQEGHVEPIENYTYHGFCYEAKFTDGQLVQIRRVDR